MPSPKEHPSEDESAGYVPPLLKKIMLESGDDPLALQRSIHAGILEQAEKGLFQQQTGQWSLHPPGVVGDVVSNPPVKSLPGITGSAASQLPGSTQVIQDALDSHRREIDRLSRHMGQLQSENAAMKEELSRQGKVLDKLLGMFRNPTKRKKGTA